MTLTLQAPKCTVDKLLGTETIKWTAGANGASGITAVLADATGSSDSITLELNGSIADAADFTVADVETVNVKIATNAESIDLSGISMTAAADVATLKVTGDKALTVSALGADVTTIDASGMGIGGSFIQTGRSSTVVQTATGSAGDDTFIMVNKGDVLSAGAGTGDTLDINDAVILGGISVDLSAADQVVSYNGSTNTAVGTIYN